MAKSRFARRLFNLHNLKPHDIGAAAFDWRNTSGLGTPVTGDVDSGLPSVNVTTKVDNAAVCATGGDWTALASAGSWSSAPGAATTDPDYRDASQYGAHIAHYANVGTARSKTITTTAPSGRDYYTFAVEVHGKW